MSKITIKEDPNTAAGAALQYIVIALSKNSNTMFFVTFRHANK